MPERAGDVLRLSADLLEGCLRDDDVVQRAEATVAAAGHDHECELMGVAMFLGKFIAQVAAAAGQDMLPAVESWRAVARRMDIAGGDAPSPN